jgi:hypothetical protein
MRWRTRKCGDERVRVRFAWFPTQCDDGYTYWLRWLRVRERADWTYESFGSYRLGWVEVAAQLKSDVPL